MTHGRVRHPCKLPSELDLAEEFSFPTRPCDPHGNLPQTQTYREHSRDHHREDAMQVTDRQAITRKDRRQGTNVRKRQALVGVRLTSEEYATIKATAERQQRSPGSVLRDAFFRDHEIVA